MNTRIITSVVIAVLALVMASCGTSRNYPDRRDYPNYPDGRYPDGRYPYPDGRYPDRRYPDGRSYPTSRNANKLPPGHAKKVYGHKSARVFAPGQQKRKHDRRDDDYRVKKYKKSKSVKYKKR